MNRALGRRGLLALGLLAVTITLAAGAAVSKSADAGSKTSATAPTSCQLGNGVKHVINIVFDNVHFVAGQPERPVRPRADAAPAELPEVQRHGASPTSHTPMIAHTADDSLTIYTGLYGDRHGQPLTQLATRPTTPTARPTRRRRSPTGRRRSSTPQASADAPGTTRRRRWPTRDTSRRRGDTEPADAGAVGAVHPRRLHGRRLLDREHGARERRRSTCRRCSAPSSPEVAQYNADPDSFKDAEVADYIGVAVHCAQGDAICATRRRSSTARPRRRRRRRRPAADRAGRLQRLPGAVRRASTSRRSSARARRTLTHNGYQVTDATGNLVDLNGNDDPGAVQRTRRASRASARPRRSRWPTSPTCRRAASRSPTATSPTCTSARPTRRAAAPRRTGDRPASRSARATAATSRNAQAYDAAFADVLPAARRGRHHPGEHAVRDQRRGERPVRRRERRPGDRSRPRPAATASTVAVQLRRGPDRRAAGQHQGPARRRTPSASTQFDIEPQGASIYVHGQPAANDPTVRQLERDTAAMTADDPYSGVNGEKIVKYQAGRARATGPAHADRRPAAHADVHAVPEAGLLLRDHRDRTSASTAASPRTTATTARTSTSPGSAMAGPGVAANGVDGPQPAGGNQPHDPNSTNTVPQASTVGTWVEETDLRPTMLHLLGLTDDYQIGRPRDHPGADVGAAPRSPRRPTWPRATSRSTRASASSRPTR